MNCSSSRAEASGPTNSDQAWANVHMPALRDRLQELRKKETYNVSCAPSGPSQSTRGRSIKPPVWTITKTRSASNKPHSFRDEYWLRANARAAVRRGSGTNSEDTLHSRFQRYIQDNSERLDIAGRPPMPNQIDMALSMDRQWQEMSEEIEKWHKQKWERLAQDQEDDA